MVSAWDNLGQEDGGTWKQTMIGRFYPNVKSLLEQTPYHQGDVAGQKLKEAMKNGDFARQFDKSLADPALRQKVAALPSDVMTQHIDEVIQHPDQLSSIVDNLPAGAAVKPPSASAAMAKVAAPAVVSAAPAAPEEDPLIKRQNELWDSISQAKGFNAFMDKASRNPDFNNAMKTVFSENASDPEKSVEVLEKLKAHIDKNEDFFVDINKAIEKSPQALSTFARDVSKDPDMAFQHMDQQMALMNNPLVSGLMNSEFGSGLMKVFDALKQIFSKLLEKLPGMLNSFGDKLNSWVGGMSGKPVHASTNDPQGRTPMRDAAVQAMGGKSQQDIAVSGKDGKPTVQPTATQQQPDPAGPSATTAAVLGN